MPRRTLLVVVFATTVLVLLAAAGAFVGTSVYHRLHRTPLAEALDRLPASTLRVGFTDWSAVRRTLHADLGDEPSADDVEAFMGRAYDSDFSAASSIDEAAVALQQNFGFSPATAQWEAYGQGRKGATMVLKVADGTDFAVLGDNLRTNGYRKPEDPQGVWRGGVDVVAEIDPTISPELQHVVLLEKEGLVVTSDTASYAAVAAAAAQGDRTGLAATGKVDDLAQRLDRPVNALIWAGDFACDDLAMSRSDQDAQARADDLVKQAGGVTPLTGLAMGMTPSRTLRVVEHFDSDAAAGKNLRSRARLAVGEAVGRGGDFADDFRLTRSRAEGTTVLLDLAPRQKTGYVLSALYDGPLIFATC